MSVAGLAGHTIDQLQALLIDLEVHWSSPCSNCEWAGSVRGHPVRAAVMEQLIVGGWLNPARRWPIPMPAFMRHLVSAHPSAGPAVPDPLCVPVPAAVAAAINEAVDGSRSAGHAVPHAGWVK